VINAAGSYTLFCVLISLQASTPQYSNHSSLILFSNSWHWSKLVEVIYHLADSELNMKTASSACVAFPKVLFMFIYFLSLYSTTSILSLSLTLNCIFDCLVNSCISQELSCIFLTWRIIAVQFCDIVYTSQKRAWFTRSFYFLLALCSPMTIKQAFLKIFSCFLPTKIKP